jgi:hypothetical protein
LVKIKEGILGVKTSLKMELHFLFIFGTNEGKLHCKLHVSFCISILDLYVKEIAESLGFVCPMRVLSLFICGKFNIVMTFENDYG